jgi:hypothetical protein
MGRQRRSADRRIPRCLAYAFVSQLRGAAPPPAHLCPKQDFAVDIVVHHDRQSAIASHASLDRSILGYSEPSQGTCVQL